MSFWSWWSTDKTAEESSWIEHGRYTDAYKSKEQYDAWDQAMIQCEDGDVTEMWRSIASFLSNENGDNIKLQQKGGATHLILYQGSIRIELNQDSKGCRAEMSMVNGEGVDLALMRKMLESNYHFKYCRYILTEGDEVKLIFDSYLEDLSPYKIYYALKEMALHGDRYDDRFAAEWESVELTDLEHIRMEAPAALVVLKDSTLELVERFFEEYERHRQDWIEHPHGLTYLILDLVYRLDYLTQPQGMILRKVEEIHSIFFHEDERPRIDKNRAAMEILQSILEMKKEAFQLEFYSAPHTFGLMETCSSREIIQLIQAERNNLQWYSSHGLSHIVEALIGFIIGYANYVYAPPRPMRMIFGLFYECVRADHAVLHRMIPEPNTWSKVDSEGLKKRVQDVKSRSQVKYPMVEWTLPKREVKCRKTLGMWIIDFVSKSNWEKE